MKICVAQTKPIKGNVELNKKKHQQLIELATLQGAQLIIFPELSLTGYEPSLANTLAFTLDDKRLVDFQEMSDQHQIIIGVGVPLQVEKGIAISTLFFQPQQPKHSYTKEYLHVDEEPYFTSVPNQGSVFVNNTQLGFAICYELSIAEHTKRAMATGAKVYLASVAKTAAGVERAQQQLATIAREHQVFVLMANSVGPSDDFVAAGQTAVWGQKGNTLYQMSSEKEGLLIFDQETEKAIIIDDDN